MIAQDLDLSFDDFGDVDQARLRLQTCTRLLSSPPLRSRLHCPYTVHAPRDPRAPWVGVRESRNLIAYSTYRTTVLVRTATARRPGNLSDARGTHGCECCAQCVHSAHYSIVHNIVQQKKTSRIMLAIVPRAASRASLPRIPAPPPRACSDQVK